MARPSASESPASHALGALIEDLAPSQALALGTLRADLPDKVEVTTKKRWSMAWCGRTSSPAPAPISSIADQRLRCWTMTARAYRPLLRPSSSARGGFWAALLTVLPALSRRGPRDTALRPAPDCRAPIPVKPCRDRTGFTSMSRRRTAPIASGFCGRCTTGAGWRARMDDGQHQRRPAGTLDRRPDGRRAGAPGVRGRASPGAAAAAGQGEPPPDRR